MTMLHSRAGAIPLEGLPITAEQQERLSHTLRCVPADHLRSLQRIVIRDRQVRDERSGEMREYAGGSTNAAVHLTALARHAGQGNFCNPVPVRR